MKKFQLTIVIGKKIIYQTIFSFTEDQEKEYLKSIQNNPNDYLKEEIKIVLGNKIGNKKMSKQLDEWGEDFATGCAKEFTDVLISANIRACVFDSDLFSSFVPHVDGIEHEVFGFPNGVAENCCISELENYTWTCKRIE